MDTDTTLAANSDVKIPTQKAVKAYVDSGGNVNASETTKGIVEEATDAEVTAGTATGATGAKLFVTPTKLATKLGSLTYLNSVKSGVTSHSFATTGDQVIAHGGGAVPKLVRFTSFGIETSGNKCVLVSIGTYDGTNKTTVYFETPEGGSSAADDSAGSTVNAICYFNDANEVYATIAIDSTNITLTWAKAGTPTGTAYLLWEAIF